MRLIRCQKKGKKRKSRNAASKQKKTPFSRRVFFNICLLLFILAVCLGIPLLYLLFDHGYFRIARPDPLLFPVMGVDVSHHQGRIDWRSLRSQGVEFAYIKATEGDDFIDKRFEENWREAKKQGIYRGAYLFYSLRFDGESQARNFMKTVPAHEALTLPPAIDLEYGGNSKLRPDPVTFRRELNRCLEMLTSHYGREPILYISSPFYRDYLKPHYDNSLFWLRNLLWKPTLPVNDRMVIWQYHHRGRLSGVETFIDMNVFNGNRDAFDQFAENGIF